MLNNFSKLAIAGAVLALASLTVQAQSLRVSVPFKFHAGSQVLPAGDYQVSVDQMSRRVTLVSLNGKDGCYLPVKAGISKVWTGKSQIVFNAYGASHFLHRVDPAGTSEGFEVFTSKAEREVAKLTPVREVSAPAGTN
jgi:hypothetical protein